MKDYFGADYVKYTKRCIHMIHGGCGIAKYHEAFPPSKYHATVLITSCIRPFFQEIYVFLSLQGLVLMFSSSLRQQPTLRRPSYCCIVQPATSCCLCDRAAVIREAAQNGSRPLRTFLKLSRSPAMIARVLGAFHSQNAATDIR